MIDKDVKIELFPGRKAHRLLDAKDEKRIADLVRDRVLPREKADYHSIRVKTRRRKDGTPEYLVVYMLRKNTYTADVVRVDVDGNYQALGFVDDYSDSDEEEEEAGTFEAGYESVDFVCATPVPEIPTAKTAVENVHDLAVNAGLRSKILLGPDATVANYKAYLRSGLRGFVNVGHGNTDLIVLYDGALHASWFDGLPGMPLAPAVVYFNSCKVFNNPLQPAVTKSGARTYIGGIVNLLIGPSEEVCECFWADVLAAGGEMGQTLKDCEAAKYPTQGAHGISGDLGPFNFISSAIEKYKVVLYGKDATSGDLVAYIHCYCADKNVMTCEFYTDGTALPENRFKGGRVGLVYPWSRFGAVLDVLRNEKPLYHGFIMSTKVGYVATQLEPVGEGSDQS